MIFQPWQFLLIALAGWVNREQLAIIEYLMAENRVLREQHGRSGSASQMINAEAWRARQS